MPQEAKTKRMRFASRITFQHSMKKPADALNSARMITTGFCIFKKLSLGHISTRFFKINDCHSSIGRSCASKKYFFAKKLRRISSDSTPRRSESDKNGNTMKKWPMTLLVHRFWKKRSGYTKMPSVSSSSTASRTTCTTAKVCWRCWLPSCLWSSRSRKMISCIQPMSLETVPAKLTPH